MPIDKDNIVPTPYSYLMPNGGDREAKRDYHMHAVPSHEELLEKAKKEPVDISRWNGGCAEELKENERYYVTNEIDLYGDRLCFALIDFQTKEKVWLTCNDLLINFMIYKEKEDYLLYYRPESDINILLLEKVRNAKPYITAEELVRYFKEMIGDRYVYFKFTVCKGTPGRLFSSRYLDMNEDEFIKRYVREYKIANIYKATKI